PQGRSRGVPRRPGPAARVGAAGGLADPPYRGRQGPGRLPAVARPHAPPGGGRQLMSAATPPDKKPRDVEEPFSVQAMHSPIMREQTEPRDGFDPITPWRAISLTGIVLSGGYYVANY